MANSAPAQDTCGVYLAEGRFGMEVPMKKNLQSSFQSRQYMLSRDFELYYYSDINMKAVAPHSHGYYEFYIFLDGDMSICVGGSTQRLTVGDIILIPPGTAHYPVVHNPSIPYRRFIFWIGRQFFDHLLSLSPDYGYAAECSRHSGKYVFHFDPFSFNALQARVIELLEELRFERFGKEEQIALSVRELVLFLNRKIYEAENPASQKSGQELYENVLSYIENNIDGELTLDEIADALFVSKYHIAHIFKQNFGLPVHRYIIKKRLSMSRNAILSGADITRTCLQCGFRDYSAFFRAFKKEYGLSPSEFARKFRQKEQGRQEVEDGGRRPPGASAAAP
ncbi:helix-turn-helix domain-containing protein [Lachnoclostridium sp. Marseille-P6806]|uniref:helix-turn-helix domain-containing protein n=1 Tax=Lachnoclostridium sp. Marseille-P6806 TaxID=2364793 RepID=UPI001F5E76F9|nr:AraC family transcriptional regulator [Lachnoclostridium sp. Marseille-P6806]